MTIPLNTTVRLAIGLAAAMLFSACANLPGMGQGGAQGSRASSGSGRLFPASEDAQVVEYFERLRFMNGPELQRELDNVRNAQGAQTMTKMRHAMLLAWPGTGFRDENRALALSDAVRTDPAASAELKRVAGMLRHYWQEQRTLREALQAAQGENRRLAESAASGASDQRRLAQDGSADQKRLQEALAEQKRLQEALATSNQKLEALKNIERNLTDRDGRGRTPAR